MSKVHYGVLDTQRATVTSLSGRPYPSEVYVTLVDGRVFPARFPGSALDEPPIGTTGTARYVSTPSSGLWYFDPDEKG